MELNLFAIRTTYKSKMESFTNNKEYVTEDDWK